MPNEINTSERTPRFKSSFFNHEIFSDYVFNLFGKEDFKLFLFIHKGVISLDEIISSKILVGVKYSFVVNCCCLGDDDLCDLMSLACRDVLEHCEGRDKKYKGETVSLQVIKHYLRDKTLYNPREHGLKGNEVLIYEKGKHKITMDAKLEQKLNNTLLQFISNIQYYEE